MLSLIAQLSLILFHWKSWSSILNFLFIHKEKLCLKVVSVWSCPKDPVLPSLIVPGCAGCAMAHPYFGRSVNPISTRGDRLCPPNYYWHTRIFRPSDGSVLESCFGIPWLYKPIVNARQFTNEDFMMSETLGLVKTLGWKVVDGIILTIQVPIYFI